MLPTYWRWPSYWWTSPPLDDFVGAPTSAHKLLYIWCSNYEDDALIQECPSQLPAEAVACNSGWWLPHHFFPCDVGIANLVSHSTFIKPSGLLLGLLTHLLESWTAQFLGRFFYICTFPLKCTAIGLHYTFFHILLFGSVFVLASLGNSNQSCCEL